MITIKNKIIEKAFDITLNKNKTCIGVDTASRTGWCRIITSKKESSFDYGFIDINSKNKYFKYNQYIEIFDSILTENDILVIEETFYGLNVKTFQMLSRLGGFIYTIGHLKRIKNKKFLLATTARKNLGFKGNAKKQVIQKEFIKKLKLKLKDEDIIDAMILAINGVCNGQNKTNSKRTCEARLLSKMCF